MGDVLFFSFLLMSWIQFLFQKSPVPNESEFLDRFIPKAPPFNPLEIFENVWFSNVFKGSKGNTGKKTVKWKSFLVLYY